MSVNPQTTALIATFRDRREADQFVRELKLAGFKDEEIGLIAAHKAVLGPVEEGSLAGVIGGGAVGALAGAAATGLIPGVGPVIAIGLLAGVLGGAVAGATAGGLFGALIGMGIPEDEAERHYQDFLAGRTLVVVQAIGRGGEAMAILDSCRKEFQGKRRAETEKVPQPV